MLITVIVPIYNMEAYLCTSLDRLLQQSFQDYEILLIDDGSKDSSGEICDRYAREHSRIRVVHKPNGGLSTARNAGIEHARGEYLTFCDPDDWVDADYLQQFVEAGMDEHTLMTFSGSFSFNRLFALSICLFRTVLWYSIIFLEKVIMIRCFNVPFDFVLRIRPFFDSLYSNKPISTAVSAWRIL